MISDIVKLRLSLQFPRKENALVGRLSRIFDRPDAHRRVGRNGWLSPLRHPSLTMGQGG